jgi:hypothetical protein
MEREEVLEAKTQVSLTNFSSSEKTVFFTCKFSTMASITRSHFARSFNELTKLIFAKIKVC